MAVRIVDLRQASMHSLSVPAGTAPVRLDVFLASAVPECSRRSTQRAIALGDVRINGRRARKGQSVRAGDIVQVADTLYTPPALQANPDLAVPILHEDAAIVALDKPAGMASHALRPEETDTVANFLLVRYPEQIGVGTRGLEAGVVHRLDTDTSGVLLVARTREAYDNLRQQFVDRQVTKEYLAVVEGDVTLPGELRTPLMHDPRNHRRMRVCAVADRVAGARPAETSYRPVERFGAYTLLAVHIPTGVMHQIRVHLASIGHPVVGDRLYGRAGTGHSWAARQLLHAHRVSFVHPLSGTRMAISSPPPADFTGFLARLRQKQRASPGSSRNARRQKSRTR